MYWTGEIALYKFELTILYPGSFYGCSCPCASMGFLTREQFKRLREAGVTSYHHNIETSLRNFPNICTTHTYQMKIDTIKVAQSEGFCVCSGGIIGMGETWEDRLDMAWVKHPHAKGNKYAELAKKYFPKGAGAILSFGLKGDAETRRKFLEAVKVFGFQANIGDAKSLIINPSVTTHIELNPELQAAADIHAETIRLSLGLEDPQDLIQDLVQAFEASAK